MATRYIGDATIRVEYMGDRNDNYRVSVSAPGNRGKGFLVGAPKVGFGKGVAYDSPTAYDDIAAAAAQFALHEDDDIGYAISSASDPAGTTRLYVRRAKSGKGRWV